MRKSLQIGILTFNSKKDALLHFKKILNSYAFGETLNSKDYHDVYELLKTHRNASKKIGNGVIKIKIYEVRYKTKCFQIVRNDLTLETFSYTKCINGNITPLAKLRSTLRDLISEDIRNVKLSYFKANSVKGKVKCQETGELCCWEELNVDHRQPNTFSVIVDRFLEVYNLNIETLEYDEIEDYVYELKDKNLAYEFREYHKNKANLRIVKKTKNLGRSHHGRIKRQKKDLKIE